jgi:ankyrin repeat protein
MSDEDDPYTMERYPTKFQVTLGRQQHNARQLMKHAKTVGRFQDMYRKPLEKNKIVEILKKTGYVEHGGQLVKKSNMTKRRKEAARELRLRQGKPAVGGGPTQRLVELFMYLGFKHNESVLLDQVRQLLAAGAVVKDAQKGGKNVIFYVLESKLWKVAELLIDHGDVSVTYAGDNLLTIAVLSSAPTSVVKKLLDKGIKVDWRDSHGRTALMFTGDVNTTKLLISRSADVSARNSNGLSVLHSAVYRGSIPKINALLDAGADIEARESKFQMTPLHLAAQDAHEDDADLVKIARLLIKRGAKVNAKDRAGDTPLDLATYPPLIKVLRDAGAVKGRNVK